MVRLIPDSFANSRCESPSPSLWSSTILANAPALSSLQPASSGSRPKTPSLARPDASAVFRTRTLLPAPPPSSSCHDRPSRGLHARVPPKRRPVNTRILQYRFTNGQLFVEIWFSNGLQMVQFRYTTSCATERDAFGGLWGVVSLGL